MARKLLGLFALGTNRLIVASAAKNSWRLVLAVFDSNGRPTFTDEQQVQFTDREKFTDWLRAYASKHKAVHIALGLGHGFSVTAHSSVSIMPDAETMRIMRTEPTTLFPEDKTTDHVNALVHHPDAGNSSLRFKVRATEIPLITDVCAAAGLNVVRITCEQAQLLQLAYASGLSAEKDVRALLITLPSSYMFVRFDAEGWHSPMYDPSVDENTASSISSAISDALPPGQPGRIAYVDGGLANFSAIIDEIPDDKKFDVVKGNAQIAFYATILN